MSLSLQLADFLECATSLRGLLSCSYVLGRLGAGCVGSRGVVGGMQTHQIRQYNPFSTDWLGRGGLSESRTVSFQAGMDFGHLGDLAGMDFGQKWTLAIWGTWVP